RGHALSMWLRSRKRKEQQHRRDNFEDRGVNGPHDGYTVEELVKASKYYFELGSGEAICDRMMFLMQHTMLLRGQTTRALELADLVDLEFEGEGPT
ncbi:hypothetical protein DM01DRAFT_1279513, partial [Hesseltinella vesiculosa]